MDGMKFVLSVDDIAVNGFSSPERLGELLNFLKSEQVQATMFVVPYEDDIPLYEKKEWLEVIERAIGEGHDLQLHGYRHSAFEFGIPPSFILAYEHERRKEAEERKLEIEEFLKLERMEERLRAGLDILQKVFGYRPKGFRSPFLATHPHLFAALRNCGIEWDSSLAINPKGWHYIRGDIHSDADWLDVQPQIGRVPGGDLLEVPLTTEYTWYLEDHDIDRQYRLLKEDIEKVNGRKGILVALSHVSPMTGPYRAALKVYKRAFDLLREQNIEITTIQKAVDACK